MFRATHGDGTRFAAGGCPRPGDRRHRPTIWQPLLGDALAEGQPVPSRNLQDEISEAPRVISDQAHDRGAALDATTVKVIDADHPDVTGRRCVHRRRWCPDDCYSGAVPMQQHQTHLLLVDINFEIEHVSEIADCGLKSADFEIGADAEEFAHSRKASEAVIELTLPGAIGAVPASSPPSLAPRPGAERAPSGIGVTFLPEEQLVGAVHLHCMDHDLGPHGVVGTGGT
jgi:hypothetical protein